MRISRSAARTLRAVVGGGILLSVGLAGMTVVRASLDRRLSDLAIAEKLEHLRAGDRLRTISRVAESTAGAVARSAVVGRLAGQAARGAAFDGDDIASLQSELSDLLRGSTVLQTVRVRSVPDGRVVASALRLPSGLVSTVDTFPPVVPRGEWFQDALTAEPFDIRRDDVSLIPAPNGGFFEPHEPFLRASTSVPDRSGAPRLVVSTAVLIGPALRDLAQVGGPTQWHWITDAGGQILDASEPGLAFSHLLDPPGGTIGDQLAFVAPIGVWGQRAAVARTPDGERLYVSVDTVLAPQGAGHRGAVILTSGRPVGPIRLSALWDAAGWLGLLALLGAAATVLVVFSGPVTSPLRPLGNGHRRISGAFPVELAVGLCIVLLGAAGIQLSQARSRAEDASADAAASVVIRRELADVIIRARDLTRAVEALTPSARSSKSLFEAAASRLVATSNPYIALQWAEGGVVSFAYPSQELLPLVGRNLLATEEELRAARDADVLLQGPLQVNDTLWAIAVRELIYNTWDSLATNDPYGVASAYIFLEPLNAHLASLVRGHEMRIVVSARTADSVRWVGETAGWGEVARRQDVPGQGVPIEEIGPAVTVSVLPSAAVGSHGFLPYLLSILAALLGGVATRLFVARRNLALETRRHAELLQQAWTSITEPGLLLRGPKWEFEFANASAAAFFGVDDPAQLNGLHPLALSPERQPDGSESAQLGPVAVRGALETGYARYGWTFRRMDGTLRDADVVLTRVFIGDEAAVIVGIRDVTDRVLRERMLHDANVHLERAQELAGAGVFTVQLPSMKIEWSRQQKLIWGMDPDAPAPEFETVLAMVHPEDRAETVAAFNAFMSTGGSVSTHYRIIRPDGDVRYLEDRHELLAGEGALEGSRVLGVSLDVTDRRRAEAEIAERLAFQEAIAANAGAAIIAGNRDGVFTYVNRAAEALLGYSAEELIGRQRCGIAHDPEELAAAAAELSAELGRTVTPPEVMSHGVRPGRSVTRRWTFIRKDGQRVPVELSVSGVWRPGEEAPALQLCVAHNLTESEQLTRRLQESEAQLRNLIDVAPVGVLLVEHDGRISLANGTAVSYTGYSREELLGKTVDELALAEPGKHRILRAGVTTTGGPRAMAPGRIVRLRRKDGNAMSVEITLTPIHGSDATMATIADVTQRVEMEALLRYQTERLQLEVAAQDRSLALAVEQMRLASAAGLGTWTVPSGGDTMRWDQQMFRLVGWEPTPDGVVTVRDWLKGVEPNSRPEVESLLRADGSTPESGTVDFVWIAAADGERRSMHMTGILRGVGDAWHVMGTLMDVTDTARATQRAADSERLAAAALDAFPAAATVLLDVEGHVVFSSAGWRALLERLGETPEGMNPASEYRDRFVPVASSSTAAKEFFRGVEAVLGGELEEISGEFWLSQGESQRLLRAHGRRLSAANGPMIVVVLEDVTEARQLQASVDRANRLDSMGTMAGGIAHDLNNALVPLMLNLGILRGLKGAPGEALLNSIEASAVRTSKMVKQLLSFAKGGLVGSMEPVDLGQLISLELAPLFRPTLPVGISFEVAREPKGGCVVLGDRDQLFQVLLNLCTNARDAIVGPGSISIRLRKKRFAAREGVRSGVKPGVEPGEYWVVEVTDSGKGIPAAQLERIFDPFYTTKRSDQGTGLGLSTALGIVRRHGGWIQVDSIEGKGSTFRAYLRAHAEEPTAIALSAESASAPDPLVSRDGTVLVVDDDEGVRTALMSILTGLGYRAVAASDGVEGLSKIAILGGKLRAIITDINMPNMDGLQFARAVRITLPDVPILVVTGSPTEAVEDEAAVLGLRHFLTKPFTQRQLTRMLEQALRS